MYSRRTLAPIVILAAVALAAVACGGGGGAGASDGAPRGTASGTPPVATSQGGVSGGVAADLAPTATDAAPSWCASDTDCQVLEDEALTTDFAALSAADQRRIVRAYLAQNAARMGDMQVEAVVRELNREISDATHNNLGTVADLVAGAVFELRDRAAAAAQKRVRGGQSIGAWLASRAPVGLTPVKLTAAVGEPESTEQLFGDETVWSYADDGVRFEVVFVNGRVTEVNQV